MGAGPNDVGSFSGLWKAIVVDNQDPKNQSRAKIRIAGIHDDDIPNEDLPWAKVTVPTLGNLHGSVRIPAVPQPVWVMFEQGHAEYPVIMGGLFTDLDTRNESVESNVPGDDTSIISGTRNQVSASENTVVTGDANHKYTRRRVFASETLDTIDGERSCVVGKDTCRVSGGRDTVIAATDKTVIGGAKLETVAGQQDLNVGGDSITDVTGQIRRTANNVSGTPLIDPAILDEAVNGLYKAIAKSIVGLEGASLTLDPVGLQTQLKSLINLTVEAVALLTIDAAVIRIGGAAANQPIALLTHVHNSPFLGLPTGPALDITTIGLTKTIFARGLP